MKTEEWLLAITAGFVIYLLNEKKKDTQTIINLQNNNNKLLNLNRSQNFRLNQLNMELRNTVDKKENLPDEIKEDLKRLISDFDKLDKNIAEELISISSLIQINEKPKALFTLSKVIENLLKKRFNKIKPFVKLIDIARTENVLSIEECHFANGIRSLRNKEGHELNVQVDEYLTTSSLMIGIGIISKLKKTTTDR